jgi:putative transposase
MPRLQATPIKITEKQKELLENHARKRTAAKHYQERIHIVLLSSEKQTNNDIAKKLNICSNTVKKWRNRWALSYDDAVNFAQGVNAEVPSDGKVLTYLLDILSDGARSGAPARITEDEKKEITAMACRKPEDYNVPVTNWTHQLLAETIIKEKVVNKISPRYVGIILKKMNYDPTNLSTGSIPT